MLSLPEARQRLAAAASPLPARSCTLREARGLRLAAAAVADIDQPPASVSAMDGYAARAADLGEPLPVSFEIPAGATPPSCCTARAPARV